MFKHLLFLSLFTLFLSPIFTPNQLLAFDNRGGENSVSAGVSQLNIGGDPIDVVEKIEKFKNTKEISIKKIDNEKQICTTDKSTRKVVCLSVNYLKRVKKSIKPLFIIAKEIVRPDFHHNFDTHEEKVYPAMTTLGEELFGAYLKQIHDQGEDKNKESLRKMNKAIIHIMRAIPSKHINKRLALIQLRSIKKAVDENSDLSSAEKRSLLEKLRFEEREELIKNAKSNQAIINITQNFNDEFLLLIGGIFVTIAVVVIAVVLILAVLLALIVLGFIATIIVLWLGYVGTIIVSGIILNVLFYGFIAFIVCLILTLAGVIHMSTWAPIIGFFS